MFLKPPWVIPYESKIFSMKLLAFSSCPAVESFKEGECSARGQNYAWECRFKRTLDGRPGCFNTWPQIWHCTATTKRTCFFACQFIEAPNHPNRQGPIEISTGHQFGRHFLRASGHANVLREGRPLTMRHSQESSRKLWLQVWYLN